MSNRRVAGGAQHTQPLSAHGACMPLPVCCRLMKNNLQTVDSSCTLVSIICVSIQRSQRQCQLTCLTRHPSLRYLLQVEDEEEEQEQNPSSSRPSTQAPNTRGTKRGRAVHQARITVPRRPLLENAEYGSSGGVQVSGAKLGDLPANSAILCTGCLWPVSP